MIEKILYHGSKSGIKGNITPTSRADCDFGSGFYMGEDRLQAAGLVAKDDGAILYTLRLTVPDSFTVLTLTDQEWLYAVLANRRRVKDFDKTLLADVWRNKTQKCDLIIGTIADDQMNAAMRAFSKGVLTDEGLSHCLKRVKFGKQYVAKTPEMCKQIEIIDEAPLSEMDVPAIENYMAKRREENKNILEIATREFRNKGYYLDQILERERQHVNRCGIHDMRNPR